MKQIKTNNINLNTISTNIKYLTIQENNFSPLVNILKIEGSYWEQFWLDILANTTDILLSNSISNGDSNFPTFLKSSVMLFNRPESNKSLSYFGCN